MIQPLKAPFPYFGGKKAIASLVWSRLGQVQNYCEPFAGSLAVLLCRPDLGGVETVNDVDCYLANFWRATQHDPEAVAEHADGPVNECDLHARHKWLVLSDDAATFRQRMRKEPDYYDAKIAGWWCWGLCCWIGSGWCVAESAQLPTESAAGLGVHAGDTSGPPGGSGKRRVQATWGQGVHAKRPKISGDNPGSVGVGVHSGGELSQQMPRMTNDVALRAGPRAGGRPQLADAYDVGRGVNSHGDIGTCEARRAWLLDWFGRLRDRLRLVRVCCGDWSRICTSDSVTTRLGTTGVFLDPPYPKRKKDGSASRSGNLYASDGADKCPDQIRDEILAWAEPRAKSIRIVIAGYEGDGYEALGWREESWEAQGGYGNRSAAGKANAKRERLWCSPACVFERGLFDGEDA